VLAEAAKSTASAPITTVMMTNKTGLAPPPWPPLPVFGASGVLFEPALVGVAVPFPPPPGGVEVLVADGPPGVLDGDAVPVAVRVAVEVGVGVPGVAVGVPGVAVGVGDVVGVGVGGGMTGQRLGQTIVLRFVNPMFTFSPGSLRVTVRPFGVASEGVKLGFEPVSSVTT